MLGIGGPLAEPRAALGAADAAPDSVLRHLAKLIRLGVKRNAALTVNTLSFASLIVIISLFRARARALIVGRVPTHGAVSWCTSTRWCDPAHLIDELNVRMIEVVFARLCKTPTWAL